MQAHLNERVSGSVVGDGEAQGIFRFINLHLLLDPFDVGEDEILEADLAPQQLVHVDLVGVEGAEQDLRSHTDTKRHTVIVHYKIHTQKIHIFDGRKKLKIL